MSQNKNLQSVASRQVQATGDLKESEGRPRGVSSTSRSLLVRLKDDDDAAWDRLVSLYAPLVYHWCRRMNLADSDVPDVAQEVFKAVSQNIERFRKERPGDTFRNRSMF